jgi:hypothetical protein
MPHFRPVVLSTRIIVVLLGLLALGAIEAIL